MPKARPCSSQGHAQMKKNVFDSIGDNKAQNESLSEHDTGLKILILILENLKLIKLHDLVTEELCAGGIHFGFGLFF